jgi:drug/metabolite transporter (DMT)-like permease
MLVWASAFPGIRAGLAEFAPLQLILVRFTISAMVLLLICLWTRQRWPDTADLPRFIALGLLGITVYQIPLNYGQLTVPSGTASLIINTAPLWAAIFSFLQLRERLTNRQIGGLGLGFLGVAMIAVGQEKSLSAGPGIGLILLAALAHSASFIIQKPLLQKYSPLVVTTLTLCFGVLPLIPWAPGAYQALTLAHWKTTGTVIYLGLFPSALAYVLWNRVVAKLPVSRAASFLYLIPPMSMLMAWFWHGEIPTWMSVGGGALALMGVAIVLQKREEKLTAEPLSGR